MSPLQPARLLPIDILRLAAYGLKARPLRVVLSALGIAIGIAAMIAVVGISTSSRAQLNQLLQELGTNLLSASPGTSLFGEAATMPPESVAMLGRIPEVERVSAIGALADARIYRSNRIPASQSGGLAVYAARLDLLETLGATVAAGAWLNEATARYPAVVLGARAATRLGIGRGLIGQPVWLGGRWFTVVGILAPVSLVPMLDLSVLIGWPAGERYLDFDPPQWKPCAASSLPPPTPKRPTKSTYRAPPMRWPPRPPPTSPSPGCCSGSARWRCWWAASASPTPW